MDFIQIGFLQISVTFLIGIFLSEELSLCQVWVTLFREKSQICTNAEDIIIQLLSLILIHQSSSSSSLSWTIIKPDLDIIIFHIHSSTKLSLACLEHLHFFPSSVPLSCPPSQTNQFHRNCH